MRPEEEDETRHQTKKAKSQHSIEKSRPSCNSTHGSLAMYIHLNNDECFALAFFVCVGLMVRASKFEPLVQLSHISDSRKDVEPLVQLPYPGAFSRPFYQ